MEPCTQRDRDLIINPFTANNIVNPFTANYSNPSNLMDGTRTQRDKDLIVNPFTANKIVNPPLPRTETHPIRWTQRDSK
jgi:hypothetical protein